jgi:Acyclic terpene utilisation family protein AtuA
VTARPFRLGCGAGYSGDRIEPAVELVERGDLDVIVFECLAERTIALAQQARTRDPDAGFDPMLEERMEAVLPEARRRGVRIVTNMGAANPPAAAVRVREIAARLGIGGLTIAVVTGDDVRELAGGEGFSRLEDGGDPLTAESVVSANAYLGAEPIADALRQGADVVITGRVADPSLFLAPIAVHHGWRLDDWTLAGRGTLVGHLLECAGQITGGYFADPGVKDVAGLARLGFPLAEVDADGTAIITKPAGSGGQVTGATCREQLLYEIHDPSSYVTPDVIADFSRVRITDLGGDRVRVEGADGRERPATLKVSVGQFDGWIGEGQISYAGAGARARGRLAGEIVAERLRLIGLVPLELRTDLIGVDALHGAASRAGDPYEIRLRVAARTASEADARRVAREVEALYTNGPAGGGGAVATVRRVLAMRSALVARNRVSWRVACERVT